MPKDARDSLGQGGRGSLRAFAPLWLWCCLALFLAGCDFYRKLVAGTTVTYHILVEGREPNRVLSVKLDGAEFKSGDRVRIGSRTLTIDAPGLEPHQRKLSVWFHARDLGVLNLTRSKGTLQVSTQPRAREIRIAGAEFKSPASNTTATTFGPLCVGDYRVFADFGFFTEERRIEVKRNEAAPVEFKPSVGVLAFTTEPTAAHFLLSSTAGPRVHIEGIAPTNVECLPTGDYQLKVWRGNYVKEMTAQIKRGETNRQHVEFDYAELRFETTPAGARVLGDSGDLGETPLVLRGVVPGLKTFHIEKQGYTTLSLAVGATPRGVHTITTNLVSLRYSHAMQQAKRLADGNYRAALAQLEEALLVVPNDSEALELKQRVESAVKAQEVELAAKKQAAEQAAAEQRQEAERRAAERLRLAQQAARKRFSSETFRKVSEREPDSQLFDAHRWNVQSDASKVADALRQMMQREDAGWKIVSETNVNGETFLFRCNGVTKLLSTSVRHAIVVIGQTEPGQAEIHAKFWDYQSKKTGLSLTQGLTKEGLVPVHTRNFPQALRDWVETQRKAVPEEFKTKLFNELK